MKIQIIRNPRAGLQCPLTEGESGDVDDVLASHLVTIGLAVCVDEPKPAAKAVKTEPIRAVPAAPQISKAATPATHATGIVSSKAVSEKPKAKAKPAKKATSSTDKPKAVGVPKNDTKLTKPTEKEKDNG